jgi:purine-nucleoside phosphorylase
MSRTYDPDYRAIFDAAARRSGIALAHGVYLAVSGPSYETPAEIAAFRTLGADAVGMSTVPEAILAHAAGLRVAGLSCIANAAAGSTATLSHQEVLAGARSAIPALTALIQAFVEQFGKTLTT